MTDRDEIHEIVQRENEDTFESFTDLDNISDTTVLAITFLLSAQVALSGLLLGGKILDTQQLGGTFFALGPITIPLRETFVTLGAITILLVFLSLNAIVKSLMPVGFYSSSVGQPLINHYLLPFLNSRPEQFSFLRENSSKSVQEEDEEPSGRLGTAVQSLVQKLRGNSNDERPRADSVHQVAENFVSDYSAVEEVEELETYELAKLEHYKEVGERKARYTGIGLAWLRLSVAMFVLQFVILFGVVVA